jgi:D-3-phosphoglycerate dehydrogenase / 2-oxoglutarate reductase
MKVLCTTSSFDASFPENIEVIKNPYHRKLTEEEVLKLIQEIKPDALLAGVEPLTRKVLENSTNLKVISRCGIGLDSVDLIAANELGIKVYNTPDAPVIPVAELTIALILSALRKVNTLDTHMRQGDWMRFQGSLLYGKTVGIVGCGRIGTYVSKIIRAFDATVLGFDPFISKPMLFQMVDFDTLLANSDILCLHIPINKNNYHLVGPSEFNKMKNGVIIINTARGGLIDENALLAALNSGKVAMAALDVFENEPYQGPLLNLPDKTVLTPHNASSAVEARFRMEAEAAANLMTGLFPK